jgi:hypothetical protein
MAFHVSMESKLKLAHEHNLVMSHVSCLNSKVYTKVGHVTWKRACNLFVVTRSMFESSKETPKFSRNASKLFRRGD